MITWATLTGGLIASCVAATAAFGAAVLTMWRTRVGELRRMEVRAQEADAERRARVVAEVIGALRAMESEVRFAPFMGGRAAGGSLEATMRFYLAERADHPLVADWLLERHKAYAAVIERWRRVWWVPIARGRRLHAAGEHLGATVSALVQWAVGSVDDEWFGEGVQSMPDGTTDRPARHIGHRAVWPP